MSFTPAIIIVGIFVPPIIAAFQPQVVVDGARRTPVPQVAPTGSEASISLHTASRTAGSYCSAQPTWRSQLAMNSLRDCVLKTAPGFGSAGGAAGEVRL